LTIQKQPQRRKDLKQITAKAQRSKGTIRLRPRAIRVLSEGGPAAILGFEGAKRNAFLFRLFSPLSRDTFSDLSRAIIRGVFGTAIDVERNAASSQAHIAAAGAA
jgi:hypothetical protein